MMWRFLQNIKRLIGWIPVLWNNYDFDGAYLLIVIEYKLKRMERLFREEGHCVGSGKSAQEMRIARLLIQRIVDDSYSDMAFDFKETGDMFMDCWFEKRPMVPKQKAWEYGDRQKQQDLNYLCDYIKKHLFSWWD